MHSLELTIHTQSCRKNIVWHFTTGELGYDGLNGTRKIGPSYAKSVVHIRRILDMHQTGTKHIVRHMQKSVVQWSVISKFTCIFEYNSGTHHKFTTDLKESLTFFLQAFFSKDAFTRKIWIPEIVMPVLAALSIHALMFLLKSWTVHRDLW